MQQSCQSVASCLRYALYFGRILKYFSLFSKKFYSLPLFFFHTLTVRQIHPHLPWDYGASWKLREKTAQKGRRLRTSPNFYRKMTAARRSAARYSRNPAHIRVRFKGIVSPSGHGFSPVRARSEHKPGLFHPGRFPNTW